MVALLVTAGVTVLVVVAFSVVAVKVPPLTMSPPARFSRPPPVLMLAPLVAMPPSAKIGPVVAAYR